VVNYLVMKSTTKVKITRIGAIVLWLFIWQILAFVIGEDLFLPSPLAVLSRLFQLIGKFDFWSSILFSIKRVGSGLFIALFLGIVLASLSYISRSIEILIEPLVRIVRAIPVASIVILVLVWVSSRNLSVVISFMIVFPIIYTSVLEGLKRTPKEMLEMAHVYRIDGMRRVRYIYIPYVIPYFEASIKTALGLSWKSAIAAEVIGLPDGSIGEKLYNAKVFFSTPDLFAWTVVIVLLATGFEKVMLFITKKIFRRLER